MNLDHWELLRSDRVVSVEAHIASEPNAYTFKIPGMPKFCIYIILTTNVEVSIDIESVPLVRRSLYCTRDWLTQAPRHSRIAIKLANLVENIPGHELACRLLNIVPEDPIYKELLSIEGYFK